VRRVHYDLFYVDHRSFLLDLRTMVRSVGIVLRRPREIGPARAATASPRVDARPAPARGPVVKGVTQ